MTDKELFRDYPCHPDQWFDADLPSAFWYLYGSRSLNIPDSWKDVMTDFTIELKRAVVPALIELDISLNLRVFLTLAGILPWLAT